jgi:Ca2+-binding EF-hand superfamily protein
MALPAPTAQGAGSEESRPRPKDSGDRTRPEAAERWKRLDQNDDGRISRSEWPHSQQAFDRIDADRDGFLTKEELRSAAMEFRGKLRNRFREMDINSDGSISRSEWQGKEEMFNWLDANRESR